MKVLYSSNSLPDTISTGGYNLIDSMKDQLVDLTDYMDDEWRARASDICWEVNSRDGRVYGVPYTRQVIGYFYNKDLFAKAGIEKPAETWDEFFDGAKIVDMHIGFLDTYRRLKEEGTVLVFDTGWEDDLSIDKYEEYLTLSDYYLPNQKEALKITHTQTVEAAAEKLLPYFHDVIIKLVKDGCLLRNERGTQLIPAMKNITTVDSTGAGDAFMSGFLYGLYYDYPIEQCLRFGNVAGGICVQGVGCLTKYVNETDLLKLAKTL